MDSTLLYPLKFEPILVEKIWGGSRIHNHLGKGSDSNAKIGESWEISGVEGCVSVVKEGFLAGKDLNWLIKQYGEQLLGKSYQGSATEFPLLIKFLDANADLSVQVHPNDQQAQEVGESRGKTEMWYIMESTEDAYIYNGFNKKMNASSFKESIELGKTIDVLNKIHVKKGDSFFVPAGRIHTIGTGTFLAEIQQSSDTTYRIYDFDRTDSEGKSRELHIEPSLKVLNYEKLTNAKVEEKALTQFKSSLVKSPFFTTNSIRADKPYFENLPGENFRIIICIDGSSVLHTEGNKTEFKKGDCVLIPAVCSSLFIVPDSGGVHYLETSID